jgi:hypothetical protein
MLCPNENSYNIQRQIITVFKWYWKLCSGRSCHYLLCSNLISIVVVLTNQGIYLPQQKLTLVWNSFSLHIHPQRSTYLWDETFWTMTVMNNFKYNWTCIPAVLTNQCIYLFLNSKKEKVQFSQTNWSYDQNWSADIVHAVTTVFPAALNPPP